jgi:6-phosphogluconolactonase
MPARLTAAFGFGTNPRRVTDNMAEPGEWRVFENTAALADSVAEWLCALALNGGDEFAVCLSGGSTPRPLYQRLADGAVASRFPWQRVHWFWGDERFVPHHDSASNYRMASDALFSRVQVAEDHIHAIPTQGLSPQQAAVAYQTTLQRYYGATKLDARRPLFDVTLLGVGENGHTASLFPGDPALQESQRWVVAVAGLEMPARITLTYPALDSSRNLAFLVTGANKRNILTRIRAGDRTLPATGISPVGRMTWFVDRTAAPA